MISQETLGKPIEKVTRAMNGNSNHLATKYIQRLELQRRMRVVLVFLAKDEFARCTGEAK